MKSGKRTVVRRVWKVDPSRFAWGLLVLLLAGVAMGQEEAPPRVVLTRVFEHGASESLTLRCTKDTKGQQDYFCELLRFRNGVEVSNVGMYSRQTKEILTSFFQILPADATKSRSEAATSDGRPRDPVLVWDISYGDKQIKGHVLRHEKERNREVLRAVMSLEGALATQFYR